MSPTKYIAYPPGFVGQKLVELLLELDPKLKIIATDVVQPPAPIKDESRLRVVKADLGDPKEVKALFEGEKVGGIFALQ